MYQLFIADTVCQWQLQLSEYSYEFKRIPGTTNLLDEYLSHNDFSEVQQSMFENYELLNDNAIQIIVNNNKVKFNLF